MQCTNHLKQMGIAVHNFHDTVNGLPPSTIGGKWESPNPGWSRAGFWSLIFPYAEQQNLYSYMQTRGFQYSYGSTWWVKDSISDTAPMNEDIRKSFGSVSIYRCPSRRGSGGALITPFDSGSIPTSDYYKTTDGGGPPYGPRGDYVFVMSFQINQAAIDETPTDTAGSGHWYRQNEPMGAVTTQQGPFRLSLLQSNNDYTSWSPRDTMAWLADGTSNQLLIGEKHIPLSVLGLCYAAGNGNAPADAPAGVTFGQPYTGDCSYLMGAQSWKVVSMARSVRARINTNTSTGVQTPVFMELTRDPDFGAPAPNGQAMQALTMYGFGSYHRGICQFLLGDGAVKSFSVTTPARTILAPLSDVCDGNTVPSL
jgi:hypothetical protein